MSRFVVAVSRKWCVFLGALLAVALLTACGSPALETPESVVRSYIKAVAENRAEDAIKYYSLKDIKESDLTAAKGKLMMIVGKQYSEIQRKGGLDSVSTSLVSEKDNIATVKLELKFKNGKTESNTMKLAKEDGKWKIRLK